MYLEKLNPQQRMAVEHGTLTDGSHIAGPLLVIAGAVRARRIRWRTGSPIWSSRAPIPAASC